jgi:hypothetical protein
MQSLKRELENANHFREKNRQDRDLALEQLAAARAENNDEGKFVSRLMHRAVVDAVKQDRDRWRSLCEDFKALAERSLYVGSWDAEQCSDHCANVEAALAEFEQACTSLTATPKQVRPSKRTPEELEEIKRIEAEDEKP